MRDEMVDMIWVDFDKLARSEREELERRREHEEEVQKQRALREHKVRKKERN